MASLIGAFRQWVLRWGRQVAAGMTPLAVVVQPAQERASAAPGMAPQAAPSFDAARMQWQFGDWDSLEKLDQDALRSHPDRAKMALLAATAHQQAGNMIACARMVRLAQSWGCDKKLVAKLLIAGVHNTLGKAAAAAQQEPRALRHFQAAVIGAGGDQRLLTQARSVREIARMGLLPQAAERIKNELDELVAHQAQPGQSAPDPRIIVLQSEMELLQHELSLAQQRNQMHRPTGTGESLLANDASADARITAIKSRSVSQVMSQA